jgi:hypothetical protein
MNKKSEWTKVEEELPDDDRPVLILISDYDYRWGDDKTPHVKTLDKWELHVSRRENIEGEEKFIDLIGQEWCDDWSFDETFYWVDIPTLPPVPKFIEYLRKDPEGIWIRQIERKDAEI